LIAPIGFHGNVIRIAPPLMISQELADKGLDIFEEVIYGID
jgi:4-aminobutyrate aminotransferase-like enzyme